MTCNLTDAQGNYSNPRCTCAPRINYHYYTCQCLHHLLKYDTTIFSHPCLCLHTAYCFYSYWHCHHGINVFFLLLYPVCYSWQVKPYCTPYNNIPLYRSDFLVLQVQKAPKALHTKMNALKCRTLGVDIHGP